MRLKSIIVFVIHPLFYFHFKLCEIICDEMQCIQTYRVALKGFELLRLNISDFSAYRYQFVQLLDFESSDNIEGFVLHLLLKSDCL